jgi:hypothetical protein
MLFAFARTLTFIPTSADRSVLDAVKVLLANESRKGQLAHRRHRPRLRLRAVAAHRDRPRR